MKTGTIIAIVLGLALVLGGCEFVQTRNKLAVEREAINAEWGQVDADLQRRADLIPNLVETVKGYAKEETGIFTALANARAAMSGARTPQEKIDANNQVSGALGRLLVVAVKSYNTDLALFPGNVVASLSGFQREDAYFKTEPGARTAPKVQF